MKLSAETIARRAMLKALVSLIPPKHSAKAYDLICSGLIDPASVKFNALLSLCLECNRLFYKSDVRQAFCSRVCSGTVNANARPQTGEASAIDPANDLGH